MNNKILIGSIIAVTILIGVSFTSVVGYRSGASDVKASPLFNIRSSRAIDEESRDLSCAYVGMEEEIIISLIKRDNVNVIFQNMLESISGMNDETFNRFIDFVISRINQNNIDKEEIVNLLIKLKDNQENYDTTDWPS